MKIGITLLLFVLVSYGFAVAPAHADVLSFTIQGTYAESLTDPTGAITLFQAGDPFTLEGTCDTDIQPVVEIWIDGDVTLVDQSLAFPPISSMSIDYASITDMNLTGISLDLINQYYPSDGIGNNAGDHMNGTYATQTETISNDTVIDQFLIEVFSNFTHLYVSQVITNEGSNIEAYIQYHYRMVQEGQVINSKHDTIDLNINSFTIIPVPSSAALLAIAMTAIAGGRRKDHNANNG